MIITSGLYALAGMGMSVVRGRKRDLLIGLALSLVNTIGFMIIGKIF
jgi:hypothetical protein